MAEANPLNHPSSFRDPSGFIFIDNNVIYRQVNFCYRDAYDYLLSSGLYQELVTKELLIPHEEAENGNNDKYKILKPVRLPFISYPYEWSFDMLKDAALLTLKIIAIAIRHGMILKDASAYNVQFFNGKMIFIDTLSFEKYDPTQPWMAYRQFCENFLAPLSLMHFHKLPLHQLLLSYPDGIPLSMTSKLLPLKTRFNLDLYLHIHLHAHVQSKSKTQVVPKRRFTEKKLSNILKSLKQIINSLQIDTKTNWDHYYDEAVQRDNYIPSKTKIIIEWLNELQPIKSAIDIGANDGSFSQLLADKGVYIISADSDHNSINRLYNNIKTLNKNIHPLLIDFANPSPSIGVNNSERQSLYERGKYDLAIALAFIHHLCVGKNLPFSSCIQMFRRLSNQVIIEFVPRNDVKVIQMISQKKDIYEWYTEENFVTEVKKYYIIKKRIEIANTGRIIYLLNSNEENNNNN